MDTNKIKRILGKNVKLERIKADVTQEMLAEWTDISVSHMSKIEQGLTSPTAIVLYKISKVLNVSMEDFFKGLEEI